jgi:catechol 2,3-dioxygenase-like lactoylglutathione lyase family enzyme
MSARHGRTLERQRAKISRVFACVTIGASDRAASRAFYETVLGPLGRVVSSSPHADRVGELAIEPSGPSRPTTRHLHLAFVTRSRDEVDRFWRAGVDAGYPSDGAPGLRPVYASGYYGGFLLDPDGNSVEAVYHGAERRGPSVIDHLWIRVADLARTRAFWSALVPALGLEIRGERPERFHVASADRSFALVQDGAPTEHVGLAFAAADGVARRVVDPDGTIVEAIA